MGIVAQKSHSFLSNELPGRFFSPFAYYKTHILLTKFYLVYVKRFNMTIKPSSCKRKNIHTALETLALMHHVGETSVYEIMVKHTIKTGNCTGYFFPINFCSPKTVIFFSLLLLFGFKHKGGRKGSTLKLEIKPNPFLLPYAFSVH